MKTKDLIWAKNLPYSESVLDRDITLDQIKERYPEAKSFPVIVVDGVRLAGYDAFKELLEQEIGN